MCLCHLTHYAKVIKTALEMRSLKTTLLPVLPLALFLSTISAKAQDMCYDNEGNFLCNETHDSTATGNQPGARNEAATGMESAPPGGVIDYVLKRLKKHMILITMRIILKRQRKIKFLKNCLLTFTSNGS